MADQLPPPTYSQRDPVASPSTEAHYDPELSEPQILIVPTVDTVNFQKGFLGADGERAAIEGELQIKGADSRRWTRITVSLRSFEAAYHQDVELGHTEVQLYAKRTEEDAIPSSMPFAIPLLPDTPQSIQTPHSLLAHTLTATLHTADGQYTSFSKRLTVHTRRYTSHSYAIPLAPETHTLDAPTRIEVQVPRNIYTSEETIPLYVTVPPPSRETVIDQGLRLRNVRVELIRVVKVRREHQDGSDSDASDFTDIADNEASHLEGSSSLAPLHSDYGGVSSPSTSSKVPLSPLFLGSTYRNVIAQSGASCRFHSSRSIQLRFLLHQNPAGSPSDSRSAVDRMDSDIESAMITQSTLLHMVSFHLKVYVSFVDTSSQRERISTIIIPTTILPPPAPLPQVSQAIDDAYQKKHDRPPTRTVREEETIDPSIPRYIENEAGPSMPHGGAPPPFEERDAPPPFFASAFEAEASSSSGGLPTFQESEREIILPEASHLMEDIPVARTIIGEGEIFGFHPSQQFDGHSDQQSLTPPPSLDLTSHVDLTSMTDQTNHITYESLGIVLDPNESESGITEQRPPPPPAMDDPSDPPPSIDSEFRSPMIGQDTISAPGGPPPPPLHNGYHAADSLGLHPPAPTLPTDLAPSSDGHAPPPYLIPDNHREGPGDSDQVTRPPPYVD